MRPTIQQLPNLLNTLRLVIKIMLINLQTLNREERIYQLILTQSNKSKGFNQFSQNPSDFTNDELLDLFSKIESRVYYISESPNFELNGTSHQTVSIKFSSFDDIVKYLINNPDKYIIYYSTFKSPLINNPSNHNDLILRGKFLEDPSYIRNQRIDEILN